MVGRGRTGAPDPWSVTGESVPPGKNPTQQPLPSRQLLTWPATDINMYVHYGTSSGRRVASVELAMGFRGVPMSGDRFCGGEVESGSSIQNEDNRLGRTSLD